RDAVEHVVDTESVDPLVRHIDEFRRRSGQLEDAVCEIDDRDPVPRADVEDVARYCRRVHETLERADRVLDVAKSARLRTVAVNLERRSRHGGAYEASHDHPVLAALARTDRVEQTRGHEVETSLLPVREREVLVHCLG